MIQRRRPDKGLLNPTKWTICLGHLAVYEMKFAVLPCFRKLASIFTWAGLLLLGVQPGSAAIGVALQMQLGNPSNASADTNNHDHYLIPNHHLNPDHQYLLYLLFKIINYIIILFTFLN